MINKSKIDYYLEATKHMTQAVGSYYQTLCWHCTDIINGDNSFVTILYRNILHIGERHGRDVYLDFHIKCFSQISGDDYSFEKKHIK